MPAATIRRNLEAKPYFDFLVESKTHDFGNCTAGSEVTTTVTCTGAALGDFALCSLNVAGGFPADLQVTANVTAADTVTVAVTNTHASNAIDLASAALRVLVIKA